MVVTGAHHLIAGRPFVRRNISIVTFLSGVWGPLLGESLPLSPLLSPLEMNAAFCTWLFLFFGGRAAGFQPGVFLTQRERHFPSLGLMFRDPMSSMYSRVREKLSFLCGTSPNREENLLFQRIIFLPGRYSLGFQGSLSSPFLSFL